MIAWEFKASLILNLVLANSNIVLCFFVFFLIIDWYFLIVSVIAQIFNAITELVIPIQIPTKEAKADME